MKPTAIYPGSFDPITMGHVDIIKRALKVFDRLIIAVGTNTEKAALFSAKERLDMIEESTKGLNVEVDSFSGLLVDYCKKKGCNVVIRGLRAVSNFEQEFQMAVMNRELDHNIETVFFMTDKEYFYLSSSAVKEIARHKGSFSKLVPEPAAEKLRERFK